MKYREGGRGPLVREALHLDDKTPAEARPPRRRIVKTYYIRGEREMMDMKEIGGEWRRATGFVM